MSRESYDPVYLQRRSPTTKASSPFGPFRSAPRKIEHQPLCDDRAQILW